ncbi:MAG: energy-coupling factor transporter ATPase [Firmicutes bacterium]|nr:energy-coupling factor transporter ATPase [Bacillota bacterium]
MGNTAIRVENYSYTYPGAEKPTLEDISFLIEEGEFVLLIGASGSGKSTLIQSLNGIIPKIRGGETSGEVWAGGQNVADFRVQEMAARIGLIFQDPESQLCSLFIADEVAFGPENFRVEKGAILKKVDEALRYVGLEKAKRKYVYEVSGGQQQRLAISSVLAMGPEILALDDPTANLDPVGTAEILSVLAKMNSLKKTILLATPLLDEFIHLANRIIVLHQGRVFANGTPREVIGKHGKQLKEELGVWIPQISEVELGLRSKMTLNDYMPLTAEEAYEKYKGFRFVPGRCNRPGSVSEPVVRVQNVDFCYPDGTHAIQDVSFNINKGRLTAILGPNGSGKSTIAKLIVGLLPLKEGNVEVCGMDVKKSSTAAITQKVGFVFQNPEHQFVRDTVKQEIAYSLEVLGKSQAEVDAGVDEMLQMFELEEYATRHPFGLSGGQKRRLSVATMLVGKPELLILDEPTYGQDLRNVETFMRLVKDQLSNGVTIVMITHSMRLVQDYADDVVVMRYGKLSYVGAPEGLWDDEEFKQDATLKAPPLQELTRLLERGGHEIWKGTRRVDEFVDQAAAGKEV